MPDDPTRSEDELTRKFKAGDAGAMCRLFERHDAELRRRIERWLPRHVQRRVSISDVLQESRIVAYERRGDFELRGERAFRNWALGIVEMKARRTAQWHGAVAKRAAGREVTRALRVETSRLGRGGPTPSQVAIASELADIARRAVQQLPKDYQEVLRLVREQHLNLKQAAECMGRSHEATKKLYGRAVTRFAAVFAVLRGEGHG